MRVLLRSTTETPDVAAPEKPIDLHRRLPGYAATPLVEASALAETLGVGKAYIKDETSRFGLPSFKVLGASWATYSLLVERLGPMPDGPLSHAGLKAWASPLRPLTLIAATDGNHGRAVARVARWFGLDARIYVPKFVSTARIRAIANEGADVIVVDGFYDASVDAALDASKRPGTLLISDTARASTDDVPKRVTAGYTTCFAEVDLQLAERGDQRIDVVAVQAGVGGLASACTHWARLTRKDCPPRVAVVEPEAAACVMTALAANEPVGVAADQLSEMNVLQCGTISLTAFDTLRAGVSCCLAVEDDWAKRAAFALRSSGVDTGLSGAAGMAGLMAALQGPMADAVRDHLGLTPDARVLVVASEAAAAALAPAVDVLRETEPRVAALA
ncbi:MAG: diaminopropionate ammonia-lyase [Alphaproteobacteria bacterium]|nr:diaminopropionate ammonia-lyase [Alphaproteobacteria bacterium]